MTLRRTTLRRRGWLAAVALGLVVCATTVAACGGGSDAETAAAATAAAQGETGATEAAGGDVSGTVRFVMLNYDPGVEEWLDSVVEEFEALHPDVTIEATSPPTNTYQDLLTTQVGGGDPPDMAAVATAWLPAFADAGELASWSDYISPDLLAGFDQTLLEGAKYDGQLYGLPYLATARALFYNEDAFEAAGITEPPATWAELVEDAKAIQESGAAEYGFSIQGKGVEAFAAWFPYVYWSFGGSLTDASGNLTIDQNACVQGLTVINDLVNTEKVTEPDVTANDLPEQMQLFTSGQAAMTITGPWLTGIIATENPELSYGVAPIPAGTDQTTLNVQDAFILFENGENKEAAGAFAEFLFSPENADKLVEGRGMLPVLEAGKSAERYQTDPLKTFVDLLPEGQFVPQNAAWTALSDAGTRAMQEMYVNGATPEETCQTLAEAATGS